MKTLLACRFSKDPKNALPEPMVRRLSLLCGVEVEKEFQLAPLFPVSHLARQERTVFRSMLAAWLIANKFKGRKVIFLGEGVARAFSVANRAPMRFFPGPHPFTVSAMIPGPDSIWWLKASNVVAGRRFMLGAR